jgi:hypothetical protein
MPIHKEGDLKVVYIPQVPMAAFEFDVPDLKVGKIVLDAIVGLSIFEFENRVKPDYSDYAGFIRYEDGEWNDVDEEEYED